MNARFPGRLYLLGLFILTIFGAVSLFQSFRTSRISILNGNTELKRIIRNLEDQSARVLDIPFDEEPTERLEFVSLGDRNTVMCWPSVGGIIVGTHLSSVELDFLKVPRFESVQCSYNATEEDEFCRQLRRVGGKWWRNHGDYQLATLYLARPTTAREKEGLLLGWPEEGGVWVMREISWNRFGMRPGVWGMRNAHTMEERCKAMEMVGATYYKNPEDCEFVKPLLDGFGEHGWEQSDYVRGDPMDEY